MSNYNSLYTAGEIGGYMGLLIGASAITLIEVFDLIIFNICRKLSKLKKVEPTPTSSTTTISVSPTTEKDNLYQADTHA